jgi:hypothetical protein
MPYCIVETRKVYEIKFENTKNVLCHVTHELVRDPQNYFLTINLEFGFYIDLVTDALDDLFETIPGKMVYFITNEKEIVIDLRRSPNDFSYESIIQCLSKINQD